MNSLDLREKYIKDYYLNQVEGYEEFKNREIEEKKKWFINMAKVGGKIVLDVGFGRGEMLQYAFLNGAKCYGIDYSPAAMEIAKGFVNSEIELLNMPIDQFYSKEFFNIIYMVDLIEHVTVKELLTFLNSINIEKNTCLYGSTPVDIKRGQYEGMHINQWNEKKIEKIFGFYFNNVLVLNGVHKGQYFFQCRSN